jgi:hypothetical protein
MTKATQPWTASAWTPPYPVYRFTVEQYHRMVETGILTTNDRVELLEGWVVPKLAYNPPHDGTVWLTQTALLSRLPQEWILRVRSAIRTADSEPVPDLVVARGPGLRYFSAHPHPEDIGLVIEIADTTLEMDRIEKGRVYARAGISTYWIIALPESRVEVYSDPKAGKRPAYREREDYHVWQKLPLPLGGPRVKRVPVRELLQ